VRNTQENRVTEDGARLRPDVVVTLPGRQKVVIDSKVSLAAFTADVNADTDVEREAQLSLHLSSIRTHIKELWEKEYQQVITPELNFVIMFVPIEGALAVALQNDPALTVVLRRRLQTLFGRSFQLEVRSAVGEGTTVTMRIPLLNAADLSCSKWSLIGSSRD
jgi:DNA anti-recombination protein RmuC